jgi:hypothetical protein
VTDSEMKHKKEGRKENETSNTVEWLEEYRLVWNATPKEQDKGNSTF